MKNVTAEVLAFLYRHWRREWRIVLGIAGSMIGATVADLFLPVFSGLRWRPWLFWGRR
jgi:ATP-binding cassette subfamily B protein